MKKIWLGGKYGSIIGNFALVDDEDFEWLNQWKWWAVKLDKVNYRAVKSDGKKGKEKRMIYMHRFINNTPSHLVTDHINGKTLDNRKENLRSLTSQQNTTHKTKLGTNNTSGYLGVFYERRSDNWYYQITIKGKVYSKNGFNTAKNAHIARFEYLDWLLIKEKEKDKSKKDENELLMRLKIEANQKICRSFIEKHKKEKDQYDMSNCLEESKNLEHPSQKKIYI